MNQAESGNKSYFTPAKHHRTYTKTEEDTNSNPKLMYKGCYPKKVIKGNINYLDHNILSLENRHPVSGAENDGYSFHESVDVTSRSKSSLSVLYFGTQYNKTKSNITEKVNEAKIPCSKTKLDLYCELQTHKPINAHRFSHFPKLRNSESMETYRKNRSFFDKSKENYYKLSKRDNVTSKIGSKEMMRENTEFMKKITDDVQKLKPQKILDGAEISSQIMEEYVKDVSYFSRHKINAANTNKDNAMQKKHTRTLTYLCPRIDTAKSIAELAEQQRNDRQRQRIRQEYTLGKVI